MKSVLISEPDTYRVCVKKNQLLKNCQHLYNSEIKITFEMENSKVGKTPVKTSLANRYVCNIITIKGQAERYF